MGEAYTNQGFGGGIAIQDAMDLERCPVDGKFTGAEVLQAIKGHILEQASIMGTYNIYPNATKAWN